MLLTVDQLHTPRWWHTAATVGGSWWVVFGLLLRCEVVFVLSPESAENDSELSALSCPDVTTDFTDRCSSRCDIFIYIQHKHIYMFLNVCKEGCFLCFENKMAQNGFYFPTKGHTHTQSCLCCFDIFVSPLETQRAHHRWGGAEGGCSVKCSLL